MPHDKPVNLDPVAQNIIRRKAKKLMHRGGFSSSELADLEQELTLHLLNRLTAFNPRRGDWDAFVAVVVTSWAAKLLRARYAAKRDYRRLFPLSALTETNQSDDDPHRETPRKQSRPTRCGRQRPDEQRQMELRLDVGQALEALPDELRLIAARLQYLSIAELARELGVPRTTLRDRIKRIRRRFQKRGLGKNH